MEIYNMFVDWKNQYCQNDCTTQTNLQIQCNPYQIISGIFHRTGTKKISQFVWRHKRPWIGKTILRMKKQSWRNQAPWLHTILQSYSHQSSMVLEEKEKYRSMEQDGKPRNKPMHLWTINLWWSKTTQGWKESLKQMVLGKLDSYV